MNTEVMFSTGKDDWETPPEFFNKLNAEFNFTLDPCCKPETAKAALYYTEKENGLLQDWGGHSVYVNPPYSTTLQRAFLKKALEESKKPGTVVVCLIPARTDTLVFHNYILPFAEIRFIKGRLKFVGAKDQAPFPSMLAIFRTPQQP